MTKKPDLPRFANLRDGGNLPEYHDDRWLIPAIFIFVTSICIARVAVRFIWGV